MMYNSREEMSHGALAMQIVNTIEVFGYEEQSRLKTGILNRRKKLQHYPIANNSRECCSWVHGQGVRLDAASS